MAAKASGDKRGGDQGGGQGNFFAVQRATWALVCKSCSMNEAVAYLVLARGSNFGTRLTSWSVDAIERYTDIARGRAKTAVAGLLKAGLIAQTRIGTKPQYYLPYAAEVARVYGQDASLTAAERLLYAQMTTTKGGIRFAEDEVFPAGSPDAERGVDVAASLVRRGLFLEGDPGDYFLDPDCFRIERDDLIWLPNSLLDGVAGRKSPVDQVRQTQDMLALQLLVELYHWQSLAADGGVHWLMIREEYEKVRVGQSGPYDVWGFRSAGAVMWDTAPFVEPHLTGEYKTTKEPDGTTSEIDTGSAKVWATLVKLKDLGLIQFVPHLIDADTEEGEVIHPCPPSTGDARERAIAVAALNAAYRLIPDGKAHWADGKGFDPIIPLYRHMENAVLVGLLRMTHRAHTAATSKWYANAGGWDRWTASYNAIGADL